MEGQTDMFSPQRPSGPDVFGCCHRYRQCSVAGQCLIPDVSYSAQCTYRYNLESGRIFYTEKVPSFSPEEYSRLLNKIDLLSDSALHTLDDVLLDLCEYNRSTPFRVVRNENLPELETLGLFNIRPLGVAFPSLCAYRKLASRILADEKFSKRFLDAKSHRKSQTSQQSSDEKLPGERSKEFLESWLNTDGIECRNQLSSPYRFLSILQPQSTYVEELYRLRWPFSRMTDRIYRLSPLAEDGLLPDSAIEAEQKRLNSATQ